LPSELPTNCLRRYRHGGTERTPPGASRRGRAVLPGAEAAKSSRACRHGIQWTLALVRAFAARARVRVVDRGSRRDSYQASAEAEDRSARCAAVVATDDGEPLSAHLGAGRGESRSAATAVASASTGAEAHAGDESAACGAAERRPAAQEGVVAAGGPQGTGVHRTGALGQPTAAGSARLTRPTDAEDPGTDACAGRGSREASGDAAADDASRSRSADGTGLRVGDRNTGALPLRQAVGQLHRAGSDGRVQRRSAPAGTHQQTRQRAAAVSAGGSSAGHGAQSAGVAQQVFPSGHAPRTEDRKSSDGAE